MHIAGWSDHGGVEGRCLASNRPDGLGAGGAVRHGPVGTPARLTTNGMGCLDRLCAGMTGSGLWIPTASGRSETGPYTAVNARAEDERVGDSPLRETDSLRSGGGEWEGYLVLEGDRIRLFW